MGEWVHAHHHNTTKTRHNLLGHGVEVVVVSRGEHEVGRVPQGVGAQEPGAGDSLGPQV